MSAPISPDLIAVLRRLKLSLILPTLPDRLALARQQRLAYEDFLLTVLADEVSRRDSNATAVRAQKARLEPAMHLERWDDTAAVTFDRALLRELATLRFLDQHEHVAVIGPVGVGKTFLAHALGHLACGRGASVLAVRTDRMLKTLKHARLDHTLEAELRRLLRRRPPHPRRLRPRYHGRDGEPRRLRALPRTPSRRLDHRHLEPRPRRVARHLRRSHARPVGH
jgi:DNA replication protein DnaC